MARNNKRAQGKIRGSRSVTFPWAKSTHTEQVATKNLIAIQASLRKTARAGDFPTLSDVQRWHRESLAGIELAETCVAGGLRGTGPTDGALRSYNNQVHGIPGKAAASVPSAVDEFFVRLNERKTEVAAMAQTSVQRFEKSVELISWAHGEWIRIHPFADFNGSTARLLAVAIAAWFGLPLNIPGKPRPQTPVQIQHFGSMSYDSAAAAQMMGTDHLMTMYIRACVLSRRA